MTTALPHPSWCNLEICKSSRGGAHKSQPIAASGRDGEAMRAWLEAVNGDRAHLVMSVPQAQQVLDLDTLSKCASLLTAFTADLLHAHRAP